MIKILFVCHGNICRSVSSEYIMKNILKNKNIENEFFIDSAATSYEEIGNTIYKPMEKILLAHNIEIGNHQARHIKMEDYDNFDYIIGMDDENILNLKRFYGKSDKIYLFYDFTKDKNKQIEDPWYTRDFEKTYNEIVYCSNKLLNYLNK